MRILKPAAMNNVELTNLKEASSYTNNDIAKMAKKIVLNIYISGWRSGEINIGLSLDKDDPLFNIDTLFDKLLFKVKNLLMAINKDLDFKVNLNINFGDGLLKNDTNTVRYLIDKEGLSNLYKLQEKMRQHHYGQLFFHESSYDPTHWDLSQVIRANNHIDNLIKKIEENNLSPFEALLFICTWAQKNLCFKDSYLDDGGFSHEKNNTIVSALNTKGVMCVGFSQFVMAIVKRLSFDYFKDGSILMPNGMMAVSFREPKLNGKEPFSADHSQSKYYLIDKKYQMEGEVIADVLGTSCFFGAEIDNNITLITLNPISTFSGIKSRNNSYKIYRADSAEAGFVEQVGSKFYVNGKSQRKVLKEANINAQIAENLQIKKISPTLLKKAYNKIIPLVFHELKAGDIIAPEVIGEKINKHQLNLSVQDNTLKIRNNLPGYLCTTIKNMYRTTDEERLL